MNTPKNLYELLEALKESRRKELELIENFNALVLNSYTQPKKEQVNGLKKFVVHYFNMYELEHWKENKYSTSMDKLREDLNKILTNDVIIKIVEV